MLGINLGRRPRFVKNFLIGERSIQMAFEAYVDEVKDQTFPAQEHSFE
jgi:3-methyl-2-oxobutanoate hydroxymethyltransferase